jgi:hypothetical protein
VAQPVELAGPSHGERRMPGPAWRATHSQPSCGAVHGWPSCGATFFLFLLPFLFAFYLIVCLDGLQNWPISKTLMDYFLALIYF